MMYVEGGAKRYSKSACYEQAQKALMYMNNYVSFMGGTGLSRNDYVVYSLAVSIYAYQYKQYLRGYGSNGAIYYNPWNIKVIS